MTPPTDFAGVLALLLATVAPYLVSGPLLSKVIDEFPIIKNSATPNWLKVAIAFGVALVGVLGSNVISGGYAGGANFGVYLQATLQQAGVLFGTMTFTNVAMSDFIPSFGDWVSGLFSGVVSAIAKIFHPAPTNVAAG